MKALLALFALALLPGQLMAAKLDSRTMTCRDLSGIVDEQKSAVIYYAKSHYQRFYSYSGYCEERMSIPAYLPTKDNPRCFVGYACSQVMEAERGSGGISVIGASAPYENENTTSSGR